MRRFSCIALFLALMLCLSGCGNGKTVVVKDSADEAPPESPADSESKEADPLELDQKNTVVDWADFTLVKVETGMQNDDYVEILSGVSEGDVVLYTASSTSTSSSMMMGMGMMSMGGGSGGSRGGNGGMGGGPGGF